MNLPKDVWAWTYGGQLWVDEGIEKPGPLAESCSDPVRVRIVALSSRDSAPAEGVGKRVVEEWLAEVDSNPSIDFDDLAALAAIVDRVAAPRSDREALIWKWLIRAADTLARNQDDERVVFLLDFDRAFPGAVADGVPAAPRMTLDLSGVFTFPKSGKKNGGYYLSEKGLRDAIRAQLPNVEVVTE